MKKIDEEELKEIELDILRDVAYFCENNNLRYYLCGGTLLGAIRHQGFIPWDDDIDIIMPRPDYIQFHQLYNNRISNYRVNSLLTDPHWYSTFAEVEDIRTIKLYKGFNISAEHGINIDIFPTDGSPNDPCKRKFFWQINNFLARIGTLSHAEFTVSKHFADQNKSCSSLRTMIRTLIKFIAIPLARCLKPLNLNMIVTKRASKYNVDQSEYIGVSTFPHYSLKECVKGTPFLKMKKRKFEDEYFNTPDYYEEYLGNLYGDYMQLPPKSKRVSHHDFEAFWKE